MFCDPYYPHGPKNLGGPFWDSIYNALGILNTLYDGVVFNKVVVNSDSDDIFEVVCLGESCHGSLTYRFNINWSSMLNFKVTETSLNGRNNGILINHSQQCISSLSGQNFKFKPFNQSRLSSHYEAVILDCIALDVFRENTRLARRISDQVIQIEKERVMFLNCQI